MKSVSLLHAFLLGNHHTGWIRFFALVVFPTLVFAKNLYDSLSANTTLGIGLLVLLYFLGTLSAFSTAVYYVKDIYNENSDKLSAQYMMASFFGLRIPHIHVNAREERSKYHRMVDVIGGPAYLEVDPGWVILTETLNTPGKLYGPGKQHYMSRYERIYEVVDLHEQEAKIPPISAFTRDRIKVIVEDAKFNYRIFDSRWEFREHDQPNLTRKPYPYSMSAIQNYAYKRSVGINNDNHPEQQSWKAAATGRVTGIIRDYISEHKLDEIIAPRDQENKYVRDTIRKKAYEKDFKENLQSIGTILHWWDPGEFHSDEKDIEKQYISNWSIDIQSEIKINKAYGDAQKLAYEELGRAEAEAELLMSIIHALDGIKLGKDKVQTLQNLILLRTAQVIKAFGSAPPSSAQKDRASSE